jgi:hypothetical protein
MDEVLLSGMPLAGKVARHEASRSGNFNVRPWKAQMNFPIGKVCLHGGPFLVSPLEQEIHAAITPPKSPAASLI